MSRSGYLVRAATAVRREGEAVDFDLVAVPYEPLDPLPGLLTPEPAEDQGLERRLPNAPDVGSRGAQRSGPGGVAAGVPTSRASLRVRAASPDAIRLTLVPGGPWRPEADGLADGIVVDPAPGTTALSVSEGDVETKIWTDAVSLRVRHRPFAWTLADCSGRLVARSGGDRRQVAGLPYAAALSFGEGFTAASLEMAPGEVIAGLGEQFGSVVHNGRILELAATDALGTGSSLVYKAAPILHSSAGYTLFLHSPGPLRADVGASRSSVLELTSEEGERLDIFLIAGSDLAARLAS